MEIDDDDKVLQLMIENNVLECEKRKAESDVEVWKAKCTQLQSRVLELENILASKSHTSELGTPLPNSPFPQSAHFDGGKTDTSVEAQPDASSRVRRQLAFAEEGSPDKRMAPDTPAQRRPSAVGVIDIDGSDDDEKKTTQIHCPTAMTQGCKVDSHLTSPGIEGCFKAKELPLNSSDNVDDDFDYVENISFVSTPRRKRPRNVVTSDAESDDSDNVPISRLRYSQNQEQKKDVHLDRYHRAKTYPKNECRLMRLRKCGERSALKESFADNVSGKGRKNHLGIPTDETVEDVDEEELSDSDSLRRFIVNSSEGSDSNAASDGHGASASDYNNPSAEFSNDSEYSSDDNYEEILSRIRRKRDHKVQWDFEADMLAAFAEDPELCLKAVCALYRQQTSDEKLAKGTIVHNGRGFSQYDALRGSKLGEFLMDGDPTGDLVKSVEELDEHDPNGLEVCRQLAFRYSKQLFEIYKNKEDPFFSLPGEVTPNTFRTF